MISASQDATCLCFVHVCSKLELVCCQKHKNVDASSTLLFLEYIYDLLRQTFKETNYEEEETRFVSEKKEDSMENGRKLDYSKRMRERDICLCECKKQTKKH